MIQPQNNKGRTLTSLDLTTKRARIARPFLYDCLTIISQLGLVDTLRHHKRFIIAGFLMRFLRRSAPLNDKYTYTIAYRLFDHRSTIVQLLFGDCLTIAYPLFDHYSTIVQSFGASLNQA